MKKEYIEPIVEIVCFDENIKTDNPTSMTVTWGDAFGGEYNA